MAPLPPDQSRPDLDQLVVALTGDFNGDGKKDLLIGATVLFGGGDGTFTAGPTNSAMAAASTSNSYAGAVPI